MTAQVKPQSLSAFYALRRALQSLDTNAQMPQQQQQQNKAPTSPTGASVASGATGTSKAGRFFGWDTRSALSGNTGNGGSGGGGGGSVGNIGMIHNVGNVFPPLNRTGMFASSDYYYRLDFKTSTGQKSVHALGGGHPQRKRGRSRVQPISSSNMTVRWKRKMHFHFCLSEMRFKVVTPECADVDLQIVSFSCLYDHKSNPTPQQLQGVATSIVGHRHTSSHHSHVSSGPGHGHTQSQGSKTFVPGLAGSTIIYMYTYTYIHIHICFAHNKMYREEVTKLHIKHGKTDESLDDSSSTAATPAQGLGNETSTNVRSAYAQSTNSGAVEGGPLVSQLSLRNVALCYSNQPTLVPTNDLSGPLFQKSSDSLPANDLNEEKTTGDTGFIGGGGGGGGPQAPKLTKLVNRIGVVIEIQECIGNMMFDRLLDVKSMGGTNEARVWNQRGLDIKHLVNSWLDIVEKETDESKDPLLQAVGTGMGYTELIGGKSPVAWYSLETNVEITGRLNLLKLRPWLSDRSAAQSAIRRGVRSGEKEHCLDFVLFKVPPHKRRAKDEFYVRNLNASTTTQKFPFICARVTTHQQFPTFAGDNNRRKRVSRDLDEFTSFDVGSVVDEDELHAPEKHLVTATVGLSRMSATMTEKMFGSIVRLFDRIQREANNLLKIYQYFGTAAGLVHKKSFALLCLCIYTFFFFFFF
ncbi:hypothetical protein RFI_08297 [Reticulomyxa filosa]|uniref:Uncharacterized protein n=1 Tax=Reticulomyxa filosa TaxID=46433 RepID=X6NS57_RETFI|nr:hypothetical protein RFI_08297 [Reticulomyxa filosa]|eukprot:ETO28831.1 hypothetical protein RFI_08297 [Reticulomyxa filosa]